MNSIKLKKIADISFALDLTKNNQTIPPRIECRSYGDCWMLPCLMSQASLNQLNSISLLANTDKIYDPPA